MGAAYDEALFNLFASGIGSFGLVQAHVVGAVLFVRIVLLNGVILPAAHFANIKAAGLREEIFSAHGAGVRVKLEPAGLADMVLTNLVATAPWAKQFVHALPTFLLAVIEIRVCQLHVGLTGFLVELCEHICGDRTSGVASGILCGFPVKPNNLAVRCGVPINVPSTRLLEEVHSLFLVLGIALGSYLSPMFFNVGFQLCLRTKALAGVVRSRRRHLCRGLLCAAALRVTARAGASVSA